MILGLALHWLFNPGPYKRVLLCCRVFSSFKCSHKLLWFNCRATNSLAARPGGNHDRLAMQNNRSMSLHQQPNNNPGINTLATNTGSHSYETPWDLGDRSVFPVFDVNFKNKYICYAIS